MSSIVTGVFKATIGLLVDKGRDVAAERLRGGDITDEAIRSWIAREINAVGSKLNGLAKKDLNTSINHFRTGLVYLFEVLNKVESGADCLETTQALMETEEPRNYDQARLPSSPTCVNVAKALSQWKDIDLDESAKRALSNAKEGFKDAGKKATEAFSNDNLETSDRIQAMFIRVAARILENVDHPEDVLAECRLCLEDLHSLPEVQNNFKVALDNGFRARFQRNKRKEIISNVCRVNRVIYDIYDVMQIVRKAVDLEKHCVDIGNQTLVDILRDVRITQTLPKSDIGHCCVTPRLLGQEGENSMSKLKMPQGIATDRKGQFIVGDNEDRNVKVFDRRGKFVKSLCPRPIEEDTELSIRDVATDRHDNIYVLVRLKKKTGFPKYAVYVFDTNASLDDTFSLRGSRGCKITINDNDKLMVLREHSIVDVYNTYNGQFVRSFGEGKLKDASAITAAHDGRVLVVGKDGSHVHVFSEMGEHLGNFQVRGFHFSLNIAFYRSSARHIVVAGKENLKKYRLHMHIYTVEGELVRTIQLDGKGIDYLSTVTVSKEGHFAVVYRGVQDSEKVLVV